MRALEFFSGIGGLYNNLFPTSFKISHCSNSSPSHLTTAGLHYALLRPCPRAVVIAAFDINDIANAVYEHNFAHRPLAIDVCSLTVAQLDAWMADIWLMSPPCQPYTRRGLQRQSADVRSAGFLCLIDKLQQMKVRQKVNKVFLLHVRKQHPIDV